MALMFTQKHNFKQTEWFIYKACETVVSWISRRSFVIVLCAKTELTNQIAEVQSGDELGGSKELHFAQRIWIIITHALRMVNTSYIEAATKHKQGKQGSLGTDLAPQQNTSRERLAICKQLGNMCGRKNEFNYIPLVLWAINIPFFEMTS